MNHSSSSRRFAAFTLPEIMVAMTIFSFVLMGVIFANIYGLSMFRITESSLTATASARKVVGNMTDEIRTCHDALVGNVKNGVFVALLNGEKQLGSGLLIQPTVNNSNYIVYFVNPSDQTFRRATSQPDSAMIIAESITNTAVFSVKNHSGQVQTNKLSSNRVIHFNLEFFQPREYKQVAEYYKIESSIARRAE